MRALVLRQPHATLLAHGLQETLTWTHPVDMTGLVALYAIGAHVGKYMTLPLAQRSAIAEMLHNGKVENGNALAWNRQRQDVVLGIGCIGRGAIIGPLVRATMDVYASDEVRLSNYSDGRYMMPLENARAFAEPIPAPRIGRAALFELPYAIGQEVARVALALTPLVPSDVRLMLEREVDRSSVLTEPPSVPSKAGPNPLH